VISFKEGGFEYEKYFDFPESWQTEMRTLGMNGVWKNLRPLQNFSSRGVGVQNYGWSLSSARV